MKLRVWHIINPPAKPQYIPCATLAEATGIINGLIARDLAEEEPLIQT
jgi:hypothetical protein